MSTKVATKPKQAPKKSSKVVSNVVENTTPVVTKVVVEAPVEAAPAKPSRSKSVPAKNTKEVKEVKSVKAAPKEPKQRVRPHVVKPTNLDTQGIGIASARVKLIMTHNALNHEEHMAKLYLQRAENLPKVPRPTEDNPNPVLPPQGPQTPIDQLPENIRATISRAEMMYRTSLYEAYEAHVLSEMNETDRSAYTLARKAAERSSRSQVDDGARWLRCLEPVSDRPEFTYSKDYEFNVRHNPKFYAKFEAWCKDSHVEDGRKVPNDPYRVGVTHVVDEKSGKTRTYNEWTRAAALVTKMSVRLAVNTRSIIASFLDCMVEQLARNGIYNCMQSNAKIVKMKHAVQQSEDFTTRVPLYRWISTLDSYTTFSNWVAQCSRERAEFEAKRKENSGVEYEQTPYPSTANEKEFTSYAYGICRSVRTRMASELLNNEVHDLSFSREFKAFCSNLVYDAIIRLCATLKDRVAYSHVKTASNEMVVSVLRECCSNLGINFEPMRSVMLERLTKHADKCKERREQRESTAKSSDEAEDEDEE
jgi:hypothetical protein